MPNGVSKFWENWHPLALGVATAGALWWLGWPLKVLADRASWNLPALYGAVFNISGIYTAFLFTFYSFIATTDRGFIGKAKKSIFYKRTVRFTISALIIGVLLTIGTIPLLLMEPGLDLLWARIAVVVWAGFAVWSTASFVRAAYLFVIFARSQDA